MTSRASKHWLPAGLMLTEKFIYHKISLDIGYILFGYREKDIYTTSHSIKHIIIMHRVADIFSVGK